MLLSAGLERAAAPLPVMAAPAAQAEMVVTSTAALPAAMASRLLRALRLPSAIMRRVAAEQEEPVEMADQPWQETAWVETLSVAEYTIKASCLFKIAAYPETSPRLAVAQAEMPPEDRRGRAETAETGDRAKEAWMLLLPERLASALESESA